MHGRKRPRSVMRRISQVIPIGNTSVVSLLTATADNVYAEVKALADFEEDVAEKRLKETVEGWEETEVKAEDSDKEESVCLFRQYLWI